MLLSNKVRLLSLFGAFAICTHLANATETVTFHFYYESGINDVRYVYNNFYDGSNVPTSQVSKSDGQTSVSVTAKMENEKNIANSFISNLTPGPNIHMVGLNTTESEPDELDFWIAGALSINGETISHEFYIARTPDHYWLGTLDGQTYTGSDGTNSQTNRGMQVYGSTTKQPYCLLEHGTEYYAVYVYPGTCDNAINQETETQELVLRLGKNVSSLSFEPLSSPESGQIADVISYNYGDNYESKTIIQISAVPLDSNLIANSFNSLMEKNKNCKSSSSGSSVYDFELHVQGLVCGPPPQYLDFYVSGYMKINGQYVVVSGDPEQNRVFVLAYGNGRWWLGTLVYPFNEYGGGGATYNNHATVTIDNYNSSNNEYDTYYYNLEATSNNKFIVHYSTKYN